MRWRSSQGISTTSSPGTPQRLRDRVGGALHAWDEDDPHHGPLLGMYAFGLEESGHYERAEEVGLAALARHPGDVWGIHGVVHTYEMRGRFTDGIRFLDARTDDWAQGSLLTVHNWWHYALYTLEAGDPARVLEIYDSALHHDGSAGVAMELLDAAALLWRLYLAEDEQSARWARLADAWESRQRRPALRLQRRTRGHGLCRGGARRPGAAPGPGPGTLGGGGARRVATTP